MAGEIKMNWKASWKVLGAIIIFGSGAEFFMWLLIVPFFSYGLFMTIGVFIPDPILYPLIIIWGALFSIVTALIGYRLITEDLQEKNNDK